MLVNVRKIKKTQLKNFDILEGNNNTNANKNTQLLPGPTSSSKNNNKNNATLKSQPLISQDKENDPET